MDSADTAPHSDISSICKVVWDSHTESDVWHLFDQWSGGFVFSEDEASALVQDQGGPCSVIVPAQAYIIKHLLFDCDRESTQCTPQEAMSALTAALQTILLNIVTDDEEICLVAPPLDIQTDVDFHKSVSLKRVPRSQLPDQMPEYVKLWSGRLGVLSFLYSAVMTRGLENVMLDLGGMGDDCLIDSTFGHGNQSLLNLMMTGVATPNVFDLSKDVSGLTLVGVQSQTDVGFLTLLEALRYCKVGDFLKSPRYPIWVIGSESHLTAIFTKETSLCVSEDTPFTRARTIFDSFDMEGNGFIPVSDLPHILAKLEMVNDPEYVEFMKERLDPEEMGVILFNIFIQELVPGAVEYEEDVFQHKTFTMYHYNGLRQSNHEKKIVYRRGDAVVYMEFTQAMDAATAPTPLLRVLRTKWPTVEVEWGISPSII